MLSFVPIRCKLGYSRLLIPVFLVYILTLIQLLSCRLVHVRRYLSVGSVFCVELSRLLLQDDEQVKRRKEWKIEKRVDDAVTPFLVTRECAHARYLATGQGLSILNGDNPSFGEL